MTLPVSGAISFNNINVELGVSGTTQASLGQASYRSLAGVASGAISMSDFYGKANAFAFTIASNTTNANLRTLAINAGWNQSSAVTATINSGVTVYSTSTGTPALTVNGSWPGGVSLVNNGVILGAGGSGGSGGPGLGPKNGYPGGGGGLALSVSSAVSITNNNRIAGGGGGGGGGSGAAVTTKGGTYSTSGGTGGGGIGNGPPNGSLVSPGGGYGGGGIPFGGSGAGGSGGSYGSSGSSGNPGYGSVAYGSGGSGGGGGGAVSGNANITWVATGTRNGGIS